jgi:peptidoglycan/LPS O-acetylase OafA/YrhL
MKTSRGEQRNPWLDAVRALAIFLVLLSHGRMFLIPIWEGFNFLKFGGYLGVELFFVLSGYLIGGLIIDATSSKKEQLQWIKIFWINRWLRTIPNYVLFIIINMILLQTGIRMADQPELIKYLTFTQNIASQHPSFFPEAWSLATEEIFYLITPILIATTMLLGCPNNKSIFIVAFFVITASIIARHFIVETNNSTWDEGIRKITALRMDALMIGVLFSLWSKSIYSKYITRNLSFILCLMLVPVIYLTIQPNSELDRSWFSKVLLFTLTSLSCAGLIKIGENLQKFESLALSKIALWSYSIYLVNLPVLSLMKYILPQNNNHPGVNFVYWITFMAMTLIISKSIFNNYEIYFIEMKNKIKSTNKPKDF